ncbi:MAG: ABC transporter substrate-binding protein [Kofleriaceae bacterium]
MRGAGRVVVAMVMATALAGCLDGATQTCADGALCPADRVCHPTAGCVSADRVDACAEASELAPCALGGVDGYCREGLCRIPVCGDGVRDPAEGCDDGNALDGDGCARDCVSDEQCGYGVRDVGEPCDDGNDVDADECRNACVLPACGDGIRDAGEACDDGNRIDGDLCARDCLSVELCGDGIRDPQEDCDDGNFDSTDACTGACEEARCGDGFVQAGVEACDDGDGDDLDACKNDCTLPYCGNGVREQGEQCDDGDDNDLDACKNDCTAPVCGNGVREYVERCDDGNTMDGDGCSAACRLEVCAPVIAVPRLPSDLDPLLDDPRLLTTRLYAALAYDPLVRLDPASNELQLALASAIDLDPDDRGALVTLRPGVQWSDSSELVADDVAQVLARLAIGDAHPGWALPLRDLIASVVVVDAQQLRLDFTRPTPLLRELLADVPMVKPGDDGALSTGPYTAGALEPGRLRLTRSATSWAPPPVSPPEVFDLLEVEPDSYADLLPAGELDVAVARTTTLFDGLSPSLFPRVALGYQDLAFLVPRTDRAELAFVALNTRAGTGAHPAIELADVRAALDLAIDRRLLAQGALAGEPVAEPSLFVSGLAPFPTASTDLDALDALMSQAGWLRGSLYFEDGGLPLTLTLLVADDAEESVVVGEILFELLEQAGFHIVLEVVAPAELQARVEVGDYQLALLSVPARREPDLAGAFHSRSIGVGGNPTGFDDGDLDALLDAAASEANAELRQSYLEEALQKIQDAHHWLALYERPEVYAVSSGTIDGLIRRPGGIDWTAVTCEQN